MKQVVIIGLFFLSQGYSGFGQTTLMDSLYQQALDKTQLSDVQGATELLLRVQKLAEDADDKKMLCALNVTMSKLGLISENNPASEEALKNGLVYCEACQDTNNLARLFMIKGVLKIKSKEYEEAVSSFQNSVNLFKSVNNLTSAANAQAKIGNVLEVQGKYPEALAYYLEFYEVAKVDPESRNFLTANIYLTGNYLYQNNPQKARIHNDQVIALAKKMNSHFEYSEGLRNGASIDYQLGNPKNAYLKMFQYSTFFRDTLMNKQSLQQAEELKAKYESEKKETQLALQQAQLEQEQFRNQALWVGLALALAVGVVLVILVLQLRKRNREKEFLVKEIHHRVKNNLQILSSLLHLQSRQITDETALDAVRAGQNRVDAMGLIHQKLYMGEHVAKVEMKDYLEQFGQNMLDSFGIENDRVRIEYQVESLYLDVDTAIPLGLIINELVTNSLKYAFPNERAGAVTIALWENEQNHLCLKVSDNGVGQANAQQDGKSTAFGTNLVQMLSKKLKGTPQVMALNEGYATQVVFERWA